LTITRYSTTWSLSGALVASVLAIALVGVGVLYSSGGWDYYRTPLRVRAYAPQHAALRPSGPVGHSLGIAGLAMTLVPVAYSVRKKWRRLARFGSMRVWLEVHIFCGIVGPVLVTFHSALKFNGLISVAYWSMVAVMLSGFVGRYLYVRIPRSIRGVELSYEEIVARAEAMHAELAAIGVPGPLAGRLENLAGGAVRRSWLLRGLRRDLLRADLAEPLVRDALELAGARASLLRRLAYLERTRRLFAMWHMFHQPLVYVMFAIVLVHIGVALYLGYAFFLQG
jgi:hypothetical protein